MEIYVTLDLINKSAKTQETLLRKAVKILKKGGTLVKMGDEEYKYCIYYHEKDGDDIHYSFGVVTYIELDFSFFGMKLQIPIYNRSR